MPTLVHAAACGHPEAVACKLIIRRAVLRDPLTKNLRERRNFKRAPHAFVADEVFHNRLWKTAPLTAHNRYFDDVK